MKSIVNRVVVLLVVGALTSVVAFAKVHRHSVTFERDLKVNGTVVEKGTYDLKFDDATGQLSIVKNGKTIAQAMTKLEPRTKKASDFQMRTTGSGTDSQLVGVTFSGWDKDVSIANNGASTSGSN
jgi:hypothetical protein